MLRAGKRPNGDMSFLGHLENQREELKRAILKAPRHRLDHLATFVETHGERLGHFLEALMSYRRNVRKFRWKHTFTGLLVSLFLGAGATFGLMISGILGGMDQIMLIGAGGVAALIIFFLWSTLLMKRRGARFHSRILGDLDKLTPLENQTRRDSWQAVKSFVYAYLEKTSGRFSLSQAKKELGVVKLVRDRGATEIREALNELAGLKDDGIFVVESSEIPEGSSTTSAVGGSGP
jgi:hypothetical protein